MDPKFRLLEDFKWKGGVVYDPPDPYNVKLNHKGIQFRLDDDQYMQLMIKFMLNGDIRANANTPLWGGNLSAQANRIDGQDSYGLQGQFPLAGGRINVDAGREHDQNRYGITYERQF